MTDAPPTEKKPRSKRIYVMWGVALALLLTAGILCWAMVVPFLQARQAVLEGGKSAQAHREKIAALGGPDRARAKLSLYLRLAPDSSVNTEAIHMLGMCGPRSVSPLLRVIKDNYREWGGHEDSPLDMQLYQAAREALIRMDKDAVAPLIVALEHKHPHVRAEAAWILMRIGDSGAVEPIGKLLQDTDPTVRSTAASCLGGFRDHRATAPLELALKDTDPSVRQAAAEALKKIRGKQGKSE